MLSQIILSNSIRFSLEDNHKFKEAIDSILKEHNDLDLFGITEPLHGGQNFLLLRNQLFQYLVESYGFVAIAIESSYTNSLIINEFIHGKNFDLHTLKNDGFSHGFGNYTSNIDLIEWMRNYNCLEAHHVKLNFYGIDAITQSYFTPSPSQTLLFVLNYLSCTGPNLFKKYNTLITSHLGSDSDWENPEALMDPSKSIGNSSSAVSLRIIIENLNTDLTIQSPDLIAKGGKDKFLEVITHLNIAQKLLIYHASLASKESVSTLLGIRDSIIADNIKYIYEREKHKGKILLFAHNSHLQRSKAIWPWYEFWPAGALLNDIFGSKYFVIGSSIGISEANGISKPEEGTLENVFMTSESSDFFISTKNFSKTDLQKYQVRSVSKKNPGHSVLSAQSFKDFDYIVFLQTTPFAIGAPPLQTTS